jgi:hypothetical protein
VRERMTTTSKLLISTKLVLNEGKE